MAQPITDVAADLPTVRAESVGAPYDPEASLSAELERQVDAYVASGVAALTGLAEETFRARLEPLRALLEDVPAAPSDGMEPTDHVPFVVVLSPDTHDLNDAVPAMRRGARRGISVIDRDEAATYRPIDGVELPEGFAYLLTGIDTGSEFCSVPPEQALQVVRSRGRTPLTITEGLALVITRPDMLRPNKCFSLMASRAGNQRVPAIWISERRPKLGWCWDRNPHTWLGAASAERRLAG